MKKIKKNPARYRFADRLFRWFTAFMGMVILLLSAGILIQLVTGARPAFQEFGFRFLLSSAWDPYRDLFGGLPFIWGTIYTSLLALLFALPLSLGIAIFISELAPRWMRAPVSVIIELLAAIPSVIYGLWGMFVFAPFMMAHVQPFLGKHLGFLPFFTGHPFGIGILTASLVLAIMIVPTISAISREVFATVPELQKEAGLALGMTRWEIITRVIIPYGRSGVFGAIVLGFGRALGETMAVTMLIGNTPSISLSLFEPGYTIASVIATEFAEAFSEMYISSLIKLGLVLFLMTLLINIGARLLLWRMRRFDSGIR